MEKIINYLDKKITVIVSENTNQNTLSKGYLLYASITFDDSFFKVKYGTISQGNSWIENIDKNWSIDFGYTGQYFTNFTHLENSVTKIVEDWKNYHDKISEYKPLISIEFEKVSEFIKTLN